MKKRVLSLFLALTLCLTLLPTAAFAEGETGGSMSGNTTIGGSESGGTGGGVYVPPAARRKAAGSTRTRGRRFGAQASPL